MSYGLIGANIEFVEVVNTTQLRMRVWERGSGEDNVVMRHGSVLRLWHVYSIGSRALRHNTSAAGDLEIEWNPDDSHVYVTGPAETHIQRHYRRLPVD